VESVHRGFEHYKEVEQVEGIGVVIVLVKIENSVGNEFVDERLSLARQGTTTVAEIIKNKKGAAVVIETTLDLGRGNLRQTALVLRKNWVGPSKSRRSNEFVESGDASANVQFLSCLDINS